MRRDFDEIREFKGYRFGVTIEPDTDHGPPWEECDGHGPVSDWTTRDKGPGERVIAQDRSHKRYYDVAEAIKIARRDSWGTSDGQRPGETAKAYAARAVEADFAYLKGWCDDSWTYLGVIVQQVDDDDQPLGEHESCWGIDNRDYAETTVVQELIDELMAGIEVASPDVVLSEN